MTMTAVFLAVTMLSPAADPSANGAHSSFSLGMNSCTASACHGGPAEVVKGKEWNSSYTIWATKDPHADAYAVLSNERSRNIVTRLAGGEIVDRKPYREFLGKHCVACHATVGDGRPSTDGFSEDGVSCASCHGSAGEWLGSGHAGRLTAGRMTNTQDLVPRAKVCVDCHVGSPGGKDKPRRDVNHDLIAAGHPRLNFEFSAYLSSLPPHWNVDKDRDRVRQASEAKKTQGNFAAETWVTGQLVAASAALELLESRADEREGKIHIWPEFSESSCYSCHHDLRAPSFRQKLFRPITSANQRSPFGSLVWGTWYSPMPRRLLLMAQPAAANDEAVWTELEIAMSSRRPDPVQVVRLSSSLRQQVTPKGNSPQTVEGLSKSVLARPAPRGDWDEVAQWYLAAVAWRQAMQEEHSEGKKPVEPGKVNQREQALKDSQATLDKLRGLLESPMDFDPTSEDFQNSVDLLLQQLAKLDG